MITSHLKYGALTHNQWAR